MTTEHERLDNRLIVLAPTSKDAALTQAFLLQADIACESCTSLTEVLVQLGYGAGALLLPEEAMAHDSARLLTEWIARQPAWSDLPVLILSRSGADSAAVGQAMDMLGNVTVLERPTRISTLISTVRSALRARQRQYQIRAHIQERELSEAKTRRLLELNQITTASMAEGMYTVDGDGLVSYVNPEAERLFGWTSDELIGRRMHDVTHYKHPDGSPFPVEECSGFQVLKHGKTLKGYEDVFIRKDGSFFPVSYSSSPLRDGNQKIVGLVVVFQDITERKRVEQELQDADRRKEEFLAILAHELRNPLAPIRNSLHILQMSSFDDPTVKRVIEMMERQVDHLVRLVDDLMEVSRISRGRVELRKELVELANVLRSAVEISRPVMEDAGHQFAFSVPSEPLLVEGDPVRLTQIVANLLNNSAKYTDRGGQIFLSVRREETDVSISVRDTGIGISPEMLSHVFELFAQVDSHNRRGQGGLGIGLTLVKSLVELHGGSVEAFSEGVGAGSEFVVRLPLAQQSVFRHSDDQKKGPAGVPAAHRVLVVDDNRDAATSLGQLLKLLSAEVKVVFSGPDALEAVSTFHPNVVLLDIGMPGMDGHEVARRIRQNPEYASMTLIALTGWGQEQDRRGSQTAGFNHHLVKPADFSVLKSLLFSLDD